MMNLYLNLMSYPHDSQNSTQIENRYWVLNINSSPAL